MNIFKFYFSILLCLLLLSFVYGGTSTITLDYTKCQDVYVLDHYAEIGDSNDFNFDGSGYLQDLVAGYISYWYRNHYSLIKFDLSTLFPPDANMQLTSAKLHLRGKSRYGDGGQLAVGVFRGINDSSGAIDSNWVAGEATFKHSRLSYGSGTLWSANGGGNFPSNDGYEFVSTPTDYNVLPTYAGGATTINTDITFDVTQDLNLWLSNPATNPNHGWLVRTAAGYSPLSWSGAESTTRGAIGFYSCQAATNWQKMPYLEVTYRYPTVSCWEPSTTVRNPRDTASLYSGMTLSGGFANYSDAGVVKIRNSKVGLCLTKNGYAIQSMRDLTNSIECLSSSISTGDLWRIIVRSPGDVYTTLNSHSFTASTPVISYENNNNTMLITLSWSNVTVAGDTGNLGVTAYIRCDKDEPVLRWKINVDNNLASYGLWKVQYPIVNRLGYEGQSDVAASNVKNSAPSVGDLQRAATGAQKTDYNHELPGWTWSMQFLSVSCGTNSSVYLACQDPNSNYKGWDYNLSTEFLIYTYPSNMTVPGADYNQEWDFCMGPISGDWFDVAQRYRTWAIKQRWCSAGPLLTRTNMSTAFKEIDYWLKVGYCYLPDPNRWDSAQVAPWMKASKEDCNQAISFYGGNLANHWYLWHKHDFDTYYPDYFPGIYGVQSTFAYYNNLNMFHTPYVNGVYFDKQLSDWSTASASAVKNVDGTYLTWSGNTNLTVMDPCCSWWRSRLSSVCHELYTNYSCKGVYLDVLAGSGSDMMCFSSTHGHPLGGGHWYVEGERKLVDVVKQDSPGITVVSEHFGEHLIDKIDGFLLCLPRTPFNCPLISSVYHDYTMNFGVGGTWFPWFGEDSKAFAAKIGRDLIYGNMMGWYGTGNDMPQNYSTTHSYVQRGYNRLRTKTRDFLLYGAMVRPPAFNQMPDVIDVNWYTNDGFFAGYPTPAIQRTGWKTQDGALGVAILNIAHATKHAYFNVAPFLNGFDTSNVQVKLFKSDANQTLTYSSTLDVAIPDYNAVLVSYRDPAPSVASSPTPSNSATGVSVTPTLTWTAGSHVGSHDVYFGTNQTNVTNATHASTEYKGNQTSASYTPGTLALGTVYYWRIDEINLHGGGTAKGTLWSFTTTGTASAPTFVGAGNPDYGNLAITPSLPSGIATNDILLLFIETANQAITIPTPNGGTWTEVTNSPQGTGTAGGTAARLTVFWSRYNGTQGAPTTSDSGSHQAGQIIAIRGATLSGNPWNITAGGVQGTASASASIPGATTTAANTFVVTAIGTSGPQSAGYSNFSSWTNSNLASLTERGDQTGTVGTGWGLGIATGTKATAGAYGNTAVTLGTAALQAMMSIAIAGENPPGQASNPTPSTGATNVSTTQDISWTAGSGATSRNVYFGTVNPPITKVIADGTALTYDTGTMVNNTTYYWRVDEKNANGTTAGIVWSFTTTAAGAMPTYVGAGNIDYGNLAITPTLPSGIATNDILLLFIETANQAITIPTPNGGTWTQVTNSPQGTGTAGGTAARLTVFWSRYNGTQGAPTTSDSGSHQAGQIVAIRGATTSGNPWDVTAGGVQGTASSSASIPGATTSVANTLIITAIGTSGPQSAGSSNFSAWTNSNLSSLTERADRTGTVGTGWGLGIATGGKATSGAYGNTAVTLGASALQGMMSIAIKP